MTLPIEAFVAAPRQTVFGPVVQLAWHAPDIAAAVDAVTRERKAGPFYLFEHIALTRCLYRGAPADFDHSSAYGQWGDLMIEFIHQHGDAPSAVRDVFGATQAGLHHAAVFASNLDAAIVDAERRGMAIALDAETADGVRFVMADARSTYGLMIELYEPTEPLAKFYRFIRRKAQDWTGADVLRRL